MTNRNGPGWIRRASLTRGRQVNAETVQWSVPEMNEEPSNLLEEIVWSKSRAVDEAREFMPFLTLMSRVKKQEETDPESAARGDYLLECVKARPCQDIPAVVSVLTSSDSSLELRELVARKDPDLVAVAVQTDTQFSDRTSHERSRISRERSRSMWFVRATAPSLPVLSTEVIAHPYQAYNARLYGADAIILLAAVYPPKDLDYCVKMTKKTGMLGLVECHDIEELDAALNIDGVKAVLLVKRDLTTMKGTVEGFHELYDARAELFSSKNIVVFAEGPEPDAHERVAGRADALIRPAP